MRPRQLAPCVALLCSSMLRADGLSDLRTALKALPAQEAVRAKIEQDSLDREEGTETRSHRTTVVWGSDCFGGSAKPGSKREELELARVCGRCGGDLVLHLLWRCFAKPSREWPCFALGLPKIG